MREILSLSPRAQIEFWTDRKYYKNVVKLTTEFGVAWGGGDKARAGRRGAYVRVRKVSAGKFRRYSGWGIKDYFANFGFTMKELVWGNVKGLCGFIMGLFQSFFRLCLPSRRPDVIFLKGGFVSLPVGLAARLFKIPYVIHESDATAGLANRLLSKRATVVALGMDLAGEKDARYVVTGIPVGNEFQKITEARQRSLKRSAGFDVDKPLVMITGGSQGALHIDEAVREILPEMLKFASVGLVAGRAHYEEMIDLKKYEKWDSAKLKSDFRMWEFSAVMHELLGAADVVVSRAGATTIAELAALEKAVVLVPFEKLPGGHQVKNAERLEEKGAVEMILDAKMVAQPGILLEKVRGLVRSPKRRQGMAEKLHQLARPDAARELAGIVINVGKGRIDRHDEVIRKGVGKDGAKK